VFLAAAPETMAGPAPPAPTRVRPGGGRGDGEEPRRVHRVGEIDGDAAAVPDEPDGEQRAQRGIGQRADRGQRAADRGEAGLLGGDRDDPRCHHEGEAAGRQVGGGGINELEQRSTTFECRHRAARRSGARPQARSIVDHDRSFQQARRRRAGAGEPRLVWPGAAA